jgi:hypothetical protein
MDLYTVKTRDYRHLRQYHQTLQEAIADPQNNIDDMDVTCIIDAIHEKIPQLTDKERAEIRQSIFYIPIPLNIEDTDCNMAYSILWWICGRTNQWLLSPVPIEKDNWLQEYQVPDYPFLNFLRQHYHCILNITPAGILIDECSKIPDKDTTRVEQFITANMIPILKEYTKQNPDQTAAVLGLIYQT